MITYIEDPLDNPTEDSGTGREVEYEQKEGEHSESEWEGGEVRVPI